MITYDPMILSYIKGYKIPFSRLPFQTVPPKVPKYSESEKAHLIEAIDNLLSLGAISKCKARSDQYLSNIFLIPKPNEKMRFILNLKSLNQFINTSHFKLEDLRTVLKLISRNSYLCTIDLKDAYYLIKIDKDYRKYLRFQFEESIYEFNILPFGLNTAPFVFTKVMKPVIRLLRTRGYLSTIYLDDICIIGHDHETCSNNLQETRRLLISLGFIINKEKSNFSPNHSCTYLGYILDTKRFEVRLPKEKIKRIKLEIKRISLLKQCKIRTFASFVGLLVSACPAVEYGWLYTKLFERYKYLSLKNTNNNYEAVMTIPKTLKSDFQWWNNAIDHSSCKIKIDNYDLVIFSDASTTGWGVACGDQRASGLWNDDEIKQHINYLEIMAAYIGLKIFAKDMSNSQILLRIDNTTAISYINRMGGIQFPHLTHVTKQLWQWCEYKSLYVFASYIRSSENFEADQESRRLHPDIEWQLADYAYHKIEATFGSPDIDLFASRLNNKCQRYVSWHRDPDAYAVNSFTISWSDFYFYAFPPFTMILKSLRKILLDRAEGIMVVPHWPTQPWYPLFKKLLSSEKLMFRANENLILSSNCSRRHIRNNITLVAGILSARR
ncbi:hypothetical protein HF086_018112 [Spodoptera exigua]|uniref:Reverse transcriptase domain-containing protein n=1 Tax=Spodoptera exigua TaxID=7107 RepID=A0A922MQ31_SPOEX|nr:hypothetical protein HF086_018112 [Spodoptera exigua]